MASAVWSCSWPWIQLHLRQRNFLFVYTMKNPGSSHINEVELDQCSTQRSLVPFNPSLPSFLCVWLQVKPGWSPTWMFHLLKLRGRNVCSHTHKHCVDNNNTDTLHYTLLKLKTLDKSQNFMWDFLACWWPSGFWGCQSQTDSYKPVMRLGGLSHKWWACLFTNTDWMVDFTAAVVLCQWFHFLVLWL